MSKDKKAISLNEAKEERLVDRVFDWTSEEDPMFTLAKKSTRRYPGWDAGELPKATELDTVKELPEEFKAQIKEVVDKAKEIQSKTKGLEERLAEAKILESHLEAQIAEIEEKGGKELAPLVKKFYEDVKIKTPQLGNSAFNAMREVGIAVAKWEELNMLIGVKVAILETVQKDPTDKERLALIRDYLKKEHPVVLRELEGYLNLCFDTTQRSIAPTIVVKDLKEQKIIDNIVFNYISSEYPTLFKAGLIKEAKTVNAICKLTNLDYIREDINTYKNKVEKAVKARLLKESGIKEFLITIKSKVLKFFAKLSLITSQGNIIAKHIDEVNNTLETLLKMLEGKLDVEFVKRIIK
jgi:hypothetical protein